MAISFCSKCGKMLIPKKTPEGIFLTCICGFSKKSEKTLISKESLPKHISKGKGVIQNENNLANYEHLCKKCGYNKAQIIDMGIFYSDEDNLILLKCGNCGHSERIGRKVS